MGVGKHNKSHIFGVDDPQYCQCITVVKYSIINPFVSVIILKPFINVY